VLEAQLFAVGVVGIVKDFEVKLSTINQLAIVSDGLR